MPSAFFAISTRPLRPVLSPIRPRIGADDPASRAHHARAEHRDRNVTGPRISVDNRPVTAERTRDSERSDAGEGRRTDMPNHLIDDLVGGQQQSERHLDPERGGGPGFCRCRFRITQMRSPSYYKGVCTRR
jgi:hypothetical protein